MLGMLTSVMTTSNCCLSATSSASTPSVATSTSCPPEESVSFTSWRIDGESSTARMRAMSSLLEILPVAAGHSRACLGCFGRRGRLGLPAPRAIRIAALGVPGSRCRRGGGSLLSGQHEAVHHPCQLPRALRHRLGCGGSLLDERAVLLRHLVHLHDGLVDLLDP